MLVNASNLSSMFVGFKTAFNTAFDGAETHYKKIAMKVTSAGREEKYGWFGQVTGLREWIGPRVAKNLSLHDWTISNRKFESTIAVQRTDIEDDKVGVLTPFVSEMGRAAAEHPDTLVFDLLKSGFTAPCYDGQPFFDAEHPVGDGETAATLVSNVQAGSGSPWFLLDASRAVKPLVYQERIAPVFQRRDKDDDEAVFNNDEFVYGVRARANAGFGLWQLAFASKQPLTAENYEAARAAMMAFKGDNGRPLGVKPNVLVCGSALEGAAMRLLNNGTRIETVNDTPVSVQNEWANTATPIVTAYLD